MAVDLTWSSPTAAQGSSGLALVTGDTLTQTSWQATISNIYLLSQLAQGPGQLQYVSATSIRFRAVNGSVIRIAGTLYNLTADITAANTNIYIDGSSGSSLGASTLYYVYLFSNSGTLTVDFSATAYAIDSTTGNYGTYIKTGVASRTLIGMIRTNASSQFVDGATQRFVRSWFNDPGIQVLNNFTTDRATTSTTFAELSTEIRCEFLAWTGEIVRVNFSGQMESAGAGVGIISVGFDGTTAEDVENATGAVAYNGTSFSLFKGGLAEGYHYATVLALQTSGNTTQVHTNANSAGKRPTLRVAARR